MEVRYDVYLEDENDFDFPMRKIELIFSHLTEGEKEILEKYNFKYEYTKDNKIKLEEENAIYYTVEIDEKDKGIYLEKTKIYYNYFKYDFCSKEIQRGIILIFILTKISFLYFYINEEKYDIKTFVSLRIFIFLIPLLFIVGDYWEISVNIYIGRALLGLFLISLIFNFITIYKITEFRIWRTILVVLYLGVSFYLLLFTGFIIGEV